MVLGKLEGLSLISEFLTGATISLRHSGQGKRVRLRIAKGREVLFR
jgi:hypothetical protein